MFTGEDRFLYGYSQHPDGFWSRRSAVMETLETKGPRSLLTDGARLACLNNANVPARSQRQMRSSAETYGIPEHRAPLNDSHVTILLGHAGGRSEMFYLPHATLRREDAKALFYEDEGGGCLHNSPPLRGRDRSRVARPERG